jgi:hypothetical protein
MYLANDASKAIFDFHIRALTTENCHVDWSSILQIDLDTSSGKITKWTHYYDGEWMEPMFYCRKAALKPSNTAASLKSLVYDTTLSFVGDCTTFASKFAFNGNFSSPVGGKTGTGTNGVLQLCNSIKDFFAGGGAGNYPHDMWVGDNTVAFQWHIRGINTKCHVNWPGIAVIKFDNNGKIADFKHYWDDDWTLAAVNCRQ